MAFGLIWVLILRFTRSIRCETVDERNNNLLDVDFGVELGCSGQEGAKSMKVKFIREYLKQHVRILLTSTRRKKYTYLNNDFHEIFLCNDVFAIDNLLHYTRQDCALVHIEINAIKLAETNQVGANEDPQVLPLQFALFSVPGMSLVL